MDLNTHVELLKSLIAYLNERRSLFDHYENQGIDLSENQNYRDFSKKRKKRSENINSIVFTPSERFRVETFLIIIIDKLTISLMHRLCAYEHDIFGFLRNLKSLINQEIVDTACKHHDTYPNHMEDTLLDEMVHFSALLRSEKNWYIFPNKETLLKMYLCTMVTNCSGERSFSTLKRVKTLALYNVGSASQYALTYEH